MNAFHTQRLLYFSPGTTKISIKLPGYLQHSSWIYSVYINGQIKDRTNTTFYFIAGAFSLLSWTIGYTFTKSYTSRTDSKLSQIWKDNLYFLEQTLLVPEACRGSPQAEWSPHCLPKISSLTLSLLIDLITSAHIQWTSIGASTSCYISLVRSHFIFIHI